MWHLFGEGGTQGGARFELLGLAFSENIPISCLTSKQRDFCLSCVDVSVFFVWGKSIYLRNYTYTVYMHVLFGDFVVLVLFGVHPTTFVR